MNNVTRGSVDHPIDMKRSSAALLVGSILFAAAVAVVPSASAQVASCGSKTNPCPLQKWMQDNMGSKMMEGNLGAVATSFDKVATMSPDASWGDWAKISKDGAAAARKGGDEGTQGAKAACKACHDKYKNEYKQKFRTKAVP
jgi:hypothetical protein